MSPPTPDPVEPLVLQLLDWIGQGGRPYAEVMDAWRTSCPRLPVWEEANDRGFVAQVAEPGRGVVVCVTERGRAAITRAKHDARDASPT